MRKSMRVILLVAVFLALFSGGAFAFEGTPKRVDVKITNVDEETLYLNTTVNTVGDALKSLNIELAKDDIVNPGLETELTDGMQITLQRAFMVNVYVDGSPKRIRVNNGSISDAIKIMEGIIGSAVTLENGGINEPLTPEMSIRLVTGHKEQEEVITEIPFSTAYTKNEQLEIGQQRVAIEGKNGEKITYYEVTYEGGQMSSKTETGSRITKQPVNQVIELGTKLPPMPESQLPQNIIPGTDLYYEKKLVLEASAYTSDRGDAGTHTYTGERARVGLVAVDPGFIPLGTELYIEGYGAAKAADTGGSIKGAKIDLFFDTYGECVRFGRRDVVAYIVETDEEDLKRIAEAIEQAHNNEMLRIAQQNLLDSLEGLQGLAE